MQKIEPEIVAQCELAQVLNNVETKYVDLNNDYNNCTYGTKSGYQVRKTNTMTKSNKNGALSTETNFI